MSFRTYFGCAPGALLASLLVALCVVAPPLHAQPIAPTTGTAATATTPAIDPGTLTRPEIRDLMSRLSDDEVRSMLLDQLDRGAVQATGARIGLVEQIEANADRVRDGLSEVLAATPRVPANLALLVTRLNESGGFGSAILALVIVLAGGLLARWLLRRRVRGQQERIAVQNAESGAFTSVAAFGSGFVWLLLELAGVVAFYIAAMALVLISWHEVTPLRPFLTTYVAAVAATLSVVAISEFFLPRRWPVYRLLALSDAATNRVKFFLVALAIVYAFGFATCQLLAQYGAEHLPHLALLITVGTLFTLGMIAMFLSVRGEIAVLIRGPSGGTGGWSYVRGLLANSWHVLASGYALLLWVLSISRLLIGNVATEDTSPGLLALGLFVAVPAIDIIAGHFLAAQCGNNSALAGAIRRTLRVILFVGATAIFLSLWGVDINRLEEAGVAGWLIGALIDTGVVALVGYAAWQLTRAYFDNLLANEMPEADDPEGTPRSDGEGGGAGASRAATLLPLLRSVAMATIALIGTLTVLAGLGVDIGPLLAGAGVIGIAIGFGAQTLVRDVVSGIFFLIDDAFRTGEYIDVGAVKGTVEKISVRSLRLRHHRGALHTVPFGEIATLTNYSRDWVIMKLPLRLTFDTDPQQVKKIIKRIGAEMQEDALMGQNLLEPPKSQGVLQMEDSAMILRVKFMAKPGEQFVLRRELLHRIRTAFAEAGIHFANREVTVHVAGGEATGEVVEQAGAAAARALLDQEAEAQQPGQPPADDR